MTLLYRNAAWNIRLCVYMGARGIALTIPLLIPLYYVEAPASQAAMVAVAGLGFLVPFLRSLMGKVWLDDGRLYTRNPFCTWSVAIDDVRAVTTRALWQNFFAVAELETRARRHLAIRLVAVPARDASEVASKLCIGLEVPD